MCWVQRYWLAGWALERPRPRQPSSELRSVGRRPTFLRARDRDMSGWQATTTTGTGYPDIGTTQPLVSCVIAAPLSYSIATTTAALHTLTATTIASIATTIAAEIATATS